MIAPETYTSTIYAADPRTAGRMSVNDAPVATAKSAAEGVLSFFKTLIDIVNPLQHIPGVASVYRRMTGDEISPFARIAGDTLYGGPVGTALALADTAVEGGTGKDVGGHMLAMLTEDKKEAAPPVMLAQAYDAIQPAAGGISSDDIVWNDAQQNFLAPGASISHRAAGEEKKPADSLLSHAPPVDTEKDGIVWNDAGRSPAPVSDLTPVLQQQDAPAEQARTAVPPELIAPRMMEALEKYTAMKKAENQAAFSQGF